MSDDDFLDSLLNSTFGRKRTCARCGRAAAGAGLMSKLCLSCEMDDHLNSAFEYTRASTTGSTSGPSFEEVLRASARKKMDEFERQARQEREKANPPPPPPKEAVSINPDAEMLRRLIQLCHPDKHANSEASQKATRWLLDLKAKGGSR